MRPVQHDPELGPQLRDAQSKGPSGAMQLMNNRPLMEKLQVSLLALHMLCTRQCTRRHEQLLAGTH